MGKQEDTQAKEKSSWYKHAVIYGLDVGFFQDGNGDGIGDFLGLTSRLDYLQSLGVTCIWLLPFYPSPNRDNGYDITNYYGIDPRMGTFNDFRTFVEKAYTKNIRIIIDLVMQHTSDQHMWFEQARQHKKSKYYNYYIWTKKIPPGPQPKPGFPGVDNSVWTFDGVAKEYYFHSFYNFEPDLNIANKDVQEEIYKVIDFWLAYGISGFRIDAATMMFDQRGLPGTGIAYSGKMMEEMNAFIKTRNKDAIMLAEADVSANKISHFFGKGNRMQLLYNFLLNRFIFAAFAEQDALPIRRELAKLPVPPKSAQWVNFLRNLDELNLSQLPENDKKKIFAVFAPDQDMRVYHRGIRRRLAPMLKGNLRRIKMVYSLLFSLPGAALFVYGDEIGMGDDLALPQRQSVRTPMQWDSSENGGFSQADPTVLIHPVISKGDFRYQKVNAQTESKNKNSLLNHFRNLITIFKTHPEIGEGKYTMVETDQKHVFADMFEHPNRSLFILNNLSNRPTSCSVPLLDDVSLVEFYSDGDYPSVERASKIRLNAYGYRWFYIKKD
jgi:maltose alpha-D-glucosyltransferase/alpha-amylase